MRTISVALPDRIIRPLGSTKVATPIPRRIAALRSSFRSAAVCKAYPCKRDWVVWRGTNGRRTAASMAISASTHTISSSVKPRSEALFIFGVDQVFGRNIGGKSAAAFLTIRAIGGDLIRRVISRCAVCVGMAPGIVRQDVALQVGSVPCCHARRALHQRREPLRRRRKAAGIEIEQVGRARKALQLNLRRLNLGLAEIVENARADQAHDQADDADDDQHLDQGKSPLTGIMPALALLVFVEENANALAHLI